MGSFYEDRAAAAVCDAVAREMIPDFRDGEEYVIVALASGRCGVVGNDSLDVREVSDLLITVASKLWQSQP